MSLETEGTIHGNGMAVQAYLPRDFAQESRFPFDAGDDFRAIISPHRAVVLVPVALDVSWPLTLRDPRRIDSQLDR